VVLFAKGIKIMQQLQKIEKKELFTISSFFVFI